MKPATALPWAVGRDSCTHNRPTRFWETEIYTGTLPVADACGSSQEEAKQDAAYIVHAANAYPELVAALRACLQSLPVAAEVEAPDRNVVEYTSDEWDELVRATDVAQSVLAKLGEQ